MTKEIDILYSEAESCLAFPLEQDLARRLHRVNTLVREHVFDCFAKLAAMLRAILQLLREFLETLAGYNGEPIDQRIETSLAAFAHRQTQAASDGLPPLAFRADLAQRANLENIRVVPTLAQSRVAEDESQWLGDRKQPLLVTHDQIVSVVIRLGGAPFTAVFRFAFLLGEIAIV